jgi:predicted acyltransferase
MSSAIKSFLTGLEVFQVRNKTILSKERVISVDALRGFDMFWIIGGDIGFQALDKVFHNRLSGFIKVQFDHVEWLGFHFEDIIMPLFLFLVGVSMTYSYRKRLSGGSSDKTLWIHTIKRVIILWILGMMVQGNLLHYDFSHIQFYTNTLQAIASGYLISTVIILYLPVFYQIISTIGLMLVYWAILALIPVGGTTSNAYTPDGNVAMFVEKIVIGRHIGGGAYTWIVSSLNFGASVMLGVFAGYMMQSPGAKMKKLRNYLIFGILLIALALILNIWHPIIKHIWTSSFVLFSGGICILLLALFFLVIDVWNVRKGTRWMIIIGSNAIFAYVAWHLFSTNLSGMAEVFLNGLKPHIGEWFEALSIFGGTAFLYLILWYMYKNKTFIKI